MTYEILYFKTLKAEIEEIIVFLVLKTLLKVEMQSNL